MTDSNSLVDLSPGLEEEIRDNMAPDEVSPQLLNLVRAAAATHNVAFRHPDISKEAFLIFMGEAWESGAKQLRICQGEEEGSVVWPHGIVVNLAGYIYRFGERKGLLPKKTP